MKSNVEENAMNVFETIFMGIIQGVTEFLPVSSSGHLAIFKQFFGMSDIPVTYDILLHLGTLVAVFICFWSDIKELIINGFAIIGDVCINIYRFVKKIIKKEQGVEYKKIISSSYRKFVMLIIVSTIPTGLIGVVFKDSVTLAGTTLLVPGLCLLITGFVLLIADTINTGSKKAKETSYKSAAFVGICQGIATLPGISRSGSTITACLGTGMDKKFAVKYSFIVSIPAILGAVVLDIKDVFSESLGGDMIVKYAIGTVIAGIVGYICIKTMLKIVKDKKFKGFAYYCFVVGAIAIIGFFVK